MSGASPDEQVSVRLIQALALIWKKIRELHPGVPGVILIPAPAHRDQMNVLGHFAALRWSAKREAEQHLHEVVVVAEHLNRPAEEIAETLLHEAAHSLNFERKIHDCSRSQYHNRTFKAAAEELGLTVEQVPHYGFAKTSLPAPTAERYRAEIDHLTDVLVHRRGVRLPAVPPGGATPTGDVEDEDRSASRSRKATCPCGFIIRVSKKTMEATTIRCESCGEPFRLV